MERGSLKSWIQRDKEEKQKKNLEKKKQNAKFKINTLVARGENNILKSWDKKGKHN